MSEASAPTITRIRQQLAEKKLSAAELAESYLKRIERANTTLNAYLEVYDDVMEQARRADDAIEQGKDKPLLGVPIALKDNMMAAGRRATAASRILEGYKAPYTAGAVQKLIDAGAVLLGRTNLDEFAMGSSTEHSAFGATKNPRDQSRVPGGSSGGSAAAVAADLAAAALGSDTGGSIRQPASFCGVVGLKPTYGRVSRNGLIAMGSSLDIIGPLARSVEDARLVFDVIKGRDPLDSTSLPDEGDPPGKEVRTIGVPRDFLKEGMDERVAEAFERALATLAEKGCTIRDIELPHARHALAMYYIIMPAEASTNLARYDGVKYGLHVEGENLLDEYLKTRSEGFGEEVRRRILLGTYVLSSGYYDAYYQKAVDARLLLDRDFAEAFSQVDTIALPTAPTPAFALGEKHDPLSMYLADIFTVPANLAGIPGMSVPMTHDDGLPLGLQFLAPKRAEDRLFSAGKMFLGEE